MKFGQKVRDKITGYEGIMTGRTEYMTGCIKVMVEGKLQGDGKLPIEWFDEQRLELAPKDPIDVAPVGGGPMREAPKDR